MAQLSEQDASYWAEVVILGIMVTLIVGFLGFVLVQAFAIWPLWPI